MWTGAAVAVAVGAVLLVYHLNTQSEARTAQQVSNIMTAKNSATLTGGDAGRIIGSAAATYVGGPKAGAAFFQLSGGKL